MQQVESRSLLNSPYRSLHLHASPRRRSWLCTATHCNLNPTLRDVAMTLARSLNPFSCSLPQHRVCVAACVRTLCSIPSMAARPRERSKSPDVSLILFSLEVIYGSLLNFGQHNQKTFELRTQIHPFTFCTSFLCCILRSVMHEM